MSINNTTLAGLREDYKSKTLDISDVSPNPFSQFSIWLDEALNSSLKEPNAMTLATVNAKGRPSARIVLLKGFNEKGFVFYTNYQSNKGQEMAHNPNVALVFLWKELERQVRIEGLVEKIPTEASLSYFQSRPIKSQLGAWASNQSQIIADRSILEQNMQALQEKFKGVTKLPLPPNWGGYRVKPNFIEFWQGRRSRLHDRICYQKKEKDWKIFRLAP